MCQIGHTICCIESDRHEAAIILTSSPADGMCHLRPQQVINEPRWTPEKYSSLHIGDPMAVDIGRLLCYNSLEVALRSLMFAPDLLPRNCLLASRGRH